MSHSARTQSASISIPGVPFTRPDLGYAAINYSQFHQYQQTESVDSIITENINKCNQAVSWIHNVESELVEKQVIANNSTNLMEMEKILLDMGSKTEVAVGVFYAFLFRAAPPDSAQTKIFMRYMETGCFQGVGCKQIQKVFADYYKTEVLPYKVYTQKDIEKRGFYLRERASRRKSATAKPRDRSTQEYMSKLQSLNSVLQNTKLLLQKVQTDYMDIDALVVHTIKRDAKHQNNQHRFIEVHQMDQSSQQLPEQIKAVLLQYQMENKATSVDEDLSLTLPSNAELSLQMKYVSGISNYHWGVDSKSHAGHLQRLSCQTSSKVLPFSPRNRIILFAYRGEDERIPGEIAKLDGESSSMVDSQPTKRRRFTQRVAKVTTSMLMADLNLSQAPDVTTAPYQLNQFQQFKVDMVEKVFRRVHTTETDIFCMPNYCDTKGVIQPQSFVHVTVHHNPISVVECECSIFRILQDMVDPSGKDDLGLAEDSITCMHCRYVQEEIVNSNSLSMVKDLVNVGVAPLTSNDAGTKKYSVLGRTDVGCSFVHVTGHMIKCQSGYCQSLKGAIRSLKKLISLSDDSDICEHLLAFKANQEIWDTTIFEEKSDNEDAGEETEYRQYPVVPPPDYENEDVPEKKFFDVNSSRWNFGGLSTHKCLPVGSEALINNVEKRLIMCGASTKNRNHDGFIIGPPLIADWQDKCNCGAGYEHTEVEDGVNITRQFVERTRLYTKQSAVTLKVLKRRCRGRLCEVLYTGESEGIFFWSSDTAVADEVGHDFFRRILLNTCTLSSYCKDMDVNYSMLNTSAAPFMSKTTFNNYFFAWSAAQNVDFRKEIDPFCGYHPKILACDGTHIGPIFKNLNMSPIEKPEIDVVKATHHRRYDRVFLPYSNRFTDGEVRQGRNHLRYLCNLLVGDLVNDQILTDDQLKEENTLLLKIWPEECTDILSSFLERRYSQSQLHALANFLIMLSGDAALSAILPYNCLNDILSSVQDIFNGDSVNSSFQILMKICPELAKVCKVFIGSDRFEEIKCFVGYLVAFIAKVHETDGDIENASFIANSFNPESGICYYFTESGEQVRKLPKYHGFHKETATGNYDDQPCEGERCKKRFPIVSRCGWSSIFLWFCPLHGHAYGFHIMPNAEGRKDPFSSLYKFLPSPPLNVFYDFACSLSEYSLNREPAYFRETRVWHDIFHGYSHKCGKVFKSRRFLAQYKVNSEICEQFNSYLQCIKYMSAHLSQSKFCFLMQIMLQHWNQQKTATFRKKLQVVYQGNQI